MKYDLLLCDADNTLFDFDRAEAEAVRQLFWQFGLKQEQIPLYRKINAECWAALERGETTQSRLRTERFERFLVASGGEESLAPAMDEAYVRLLGAQSFLLDGAAAFAQRVGARMQLWLVTNGIASIQHSRFERSGIAPFVDGILISEEVGAAKPDPQMIFAALEKTGVAQNRVILMGDSETADIAAAVNAGIPSILFAPGGPRASAADYTVQTYAQAENILFEL